MFISKIIKSTSLFFATLSLLIPFSTFSAEPPAIASDFSNVTWNSGDANPSSWAQTATLSSVTITGAGKAPDQGVISTPFDKADSWPTDHSKGFVAVAGDAPTIGNFWIFVYVDNTWKAATYDWIRPGQIAKDTSNIVCGGIEGTLKGLSGFKPKTGEKYGFMVTGTARNNVPANVKERSNIVMQNWSGPTDTTTCGNGSTPNPTGNRKIDKIVPDSAKIGEEITITGVGLDKTIQFWDSNNGRSSVTGTINSAKTEVKVTIPNYLVRGRYTIKSGPNIREVTNGFPFTITEGATPVVESISPLRARVGEQVTIVGSNLSSSVEMESVRGGQKYTVPGVAEDMNRKLIFEVPDVASGSYKVSVISPDGNTLAPRNIDVITGGTPLPTITNPPIPTEGLTDFGGLIALIFAWSLRLLGLSIFLVIAYSGLKIFMANGDLSAIKTSRERIKDALIGGLILLAAYLILYTINPDLVRGNISLPGVGVTRE